MYRVSRQLGRLWRGLPPVARQIAVGAVLGLVAGGMAARWMGW